MIKKWLKQRKNMWKLGLLKNVTIGNKYYFGICWLHIIVSSLANGLETVISEKENNQIHSFQVGYMSNSILRIIKAFKEQVGSNLYLIFDYKTMAPIRKLSRKYNTRVISLLMFYANIKNIISEVLSSAVYCIMDNYQYVLIICVASKLNLIFQIKDLKTQHSMIFQELAVQNHYWV